MKKVWVLEYFPEDISDGNGVFSSYEKAKACFENDCNRCADIWDDIVFMEVNNYNGTPSLYANWFIDNVEYAAYIYRTEIDLNAVE